MPSLMLGSPFLKPSQCRRINWAHPLTRGLVSYILLNEGGGKTATDLVRPTNVLTGGSTAGWAGAPDGLAPHFNELATDVFHGSTGPSLSGSPLTIAARFVAFRAWDAAWATALGSLSSTANDSVLHLAAPTATAVRFGMWFDDLDVTVPSSTNVWWTAVGTLDAALNQRLVLNGGQYSGSRTPASAFKGITEQTIGGQWSNAAFNGLVSWVAIWNRPLSSEEITWLNADPYGLIDQSTTRRGLWVAVPYSSGTVHLLSLAGTLTSGGTLGKVAGKGLAGTLTPSGAISKAIAKGLAGILTSAGTMTKTAHKSVAGTLSSGGVMTRAVAKHMAGVLASSGVLSKHASRTFTGTLASAGALSKRVAKSLSGVMASAGTLSISLTSGAQMFYVTVAGTLTSAGTLSKTVRKSLAGTLTSTGMLAKRVAMHLAGTLASSGAVTLGRLFAVHLTGTLSSTGTLGKRVARTFGGTMSASGMLRKVASRAFAGTLTSAGSVVLRVPLKVIGRIRATIAPVSGIGATITPVDTTRATIEED